MKAVRTAAVSVVLALLMPAQEPASAAPVACERLASLRLSNASITFAGEVAPGAFTLPPPADPARGNPPAAVRAVAALPTFCRATATSRPTSDSEIKVEVWLPVSGWNGKLQAVGNGGWAGTIPYAAMATALAGGYAAAGTDTGHSTQGASFALGHPEKLVDYAHRSLHELAVHAKAVVNGYYGSSPRVSLWNGCSTGGNQGLTLASMYPTDFDAIIAGAPPDPRARLHAVRVLAHRIVHRTPGSYIPPDKYRILHEAVMNACDARDGVKDGILATPQSCRFDPKVVQCKGADVASCLTAEQVETARALYSDVKHPRTGEVLYPPLLQPGSELMWGTLAGPQPYVNAVEPYKFLVAKDPAWDPASFHPERDIEAMDRDGAVLNTVTPNLKPFFARGGKLLMYHGWNDQQVPATSSINYFTRVLDAVGKNTAGTSIQLYMVPGMNHCQGGVGTDNFDKVAAIEEWIASGKAPSQIVARHVTDGKVDRTRALCPYPQVPVYKGSGSTEDATNFACRDEGR